MCKKQLEFLNEMLPFEHYELYDMFTKGDLQHIIRLEEYHEDNAWFLNLIRENYIFQHQMKINDRTAATLIAEELAKEKRKWV